MRRHRVPSIAALLIFISIGACGGKKSAAPTTGSPPNLTPGALQAGAAAVDITPAGGAPLAGYGGAPRREITATNIALATAALSGNCTDPTPADAATFFRPSTGTHDAIKAKALVLSNGFHELAFVKVDTVGVSRKLRDDLFAAAAAPLGIAYADFVILGTHTHSGPGAVADKPLWEVAGTDCFSDAVYQQVLAGAKAALVQAHAARQPAEVGFAMATETAASENRRGRPGIYDPDIGIMRVSTASGGTPIAALFNFAVHGTSLDESNFLFSADCMGEMEKVIEAGLPGTVAIFTNGAEGDVAPVHKNFGGAALMGTMIGNHVVAKWPGITTAGTVALGGALIDVAMPAPKYNTGVGCLPVPESTDTLCNLLPGLPLGVALSPSWLSTTLPFQALRVGDGVFVAVPGEPITELGWDIKAWAKVKGFAYAFVVALANDHGGYFTTLAEYQRGKYEGNSTLYGETTGEIVVDSAKSVLSLVQ